MTGVFTNTWTATDASGNTSSVTQTIWVEDTTPPELAVTGFTVELDESGNGSIGVEDVVLDLFDLSGITDLTIDLSTFDCEDVGYQDVFVTAIDASGNSTTESTFVYVVDNVAPVAVAQNFTLVLDAVGEGTITPADVDGGSSDACGIAVLGVSPDFFDIGDVGPNPVTLTVTDVNGNSAEAEAVVTVEIDPTPEVMLPGGGVYLSVDGDNVLLTGPEGFPVYLDLPQSALTSLTFTGTPGADDQLSIDVDGLLLPVSSKVERAEMTC